MNMQNRKELITKIVSAVLLVGLSLVFTYIPFTEEASIEKVDHITHSEVLFEEGRFLFNIGQYKEALEKLDSSLSLQKFYAPAYYYQGSAYRRIGILDSALISFKKATKLDPESYQVRIEMAQILLEKGHAKEGGKLLFEAYRINPKRAPANKLLQKIK